MNQQLHELIRTKDRDIQPFLFAYHVQKILQVHPKHVIAILAYGSFLNEKTKSSTSTPDFYVITDNYKQFYTSSIHSFLNHHLPPNIYHLTTHQISCKYCVISIEHLEKEVSDKTKDVYHLGRFSKRMGLIWACDPATEQRIIHAQMTAALTVTKKVLQSLEYDFTLDDFIQRAIYLSYLGDVRIEAADKVQKIIDAEKKYYEDVFRITLMELNVPKNPQGMYKAQKSIFKKLADRIKFKKFITVSKIRARGRWPKNMLTVDNWLDYMLAKIERTQGIKIELSAKEKKYWYIFGWKHFFRLSRKKLIK